MVIQEDALDFFIVGFAIHKEQRYCIKKKNHLWQKQWLQIIGE